VFFLLPFGGSCLKSCKKTFSEHPPLYAKPKALPAHPPANEPVVRLQIVFFFCFMLSEEKQ
jgi:hypothetical protein